MEFPEGNNCLSFIYEGLFEKRFQEIFEQCLKMESLKEKTVKRFEDVSGKILSLEGFQMKT